MISPMIDDNIVTPSITERTMTSGRNYKRVTASTALSWEFRQLPFWERVARQTEIREDGCHIFTGTVDDCGYGRIHNDEGKPVRLHRAIWELNNRKLLPKECVCHRCDVPACINPTHLFVGSQVVNIADMDAKGRRVANKGSHHGRAKLTEGDVIEIRRLVGAYTDLAIARSYGVSEATIRFIRWRRTWKHVT
jgi:hypothetical protein